MLVLPVLPAWRAAHKRNPTVNRQRVCSGAAGCSLGGPRWKTVAESPHEDDQRPALLPGASRMDNLSKTHI